MNRGSVRLQDHIPSHVSALYARIDPLKQIHLLGFGESMKWLARLLANADTPFGLYDWRPEFLGYRLATPTCTDSKGVASAHEIEEDPRAQIVLCSDTFVLIAEAIRFLVRSAIRETPVLFHLERPYTPTEDRSAIRNLMARAQARATSLNSHDRLFNLLQAVQQTQTVPGDVCEFGCFTGGSAAVLAEELLTQRSHKQLFLFDSFKGLPPSPFGMDHRWQGSFSNVCLEEITHAFADLPQVHIVPGDIRDTVPKVQRPLSLVHVDTDTYAGAEAVARQCWPLLSPGGIMLFDDYGFFPNCIPLTVFVDTFIAELSDAFSFYLPSGGMLLLKKDL